MSAFTTEYRDAIFICSYAGHPSEDLLKRNSLKAEGCLYPHVEETEKKIPTRLIANGLVFVSCRVKR
jgi:hypothetical protein